MVHYVALGFSIKQETCIDNITGDGGGGGVKGRGVVVGGWPNSPFSKEIYDELSIFHKIRIKG